MKKPNLFIVGAPKCGTTALHEYLKQHPDIFMCEPKEPGHFNKDFHQEQKIYNGKILAPYADEERYLSLFKNAKNEKIIGESSTGYLRSKKAPQLIKKFNPLARIIVMLRNPVDLLYSLHSQQVFNLEEPVADFQKALSLERKRKNGDLPDGTRVPMKLFYRDWVKFTEQLNRYYKYFPNQQVKVIIYDDFKNATLNVYKEVLDFLRVDKNFCPEFRHFNVNKHVKMPKIKYFLDWLKLNRKLEGVIPSRYYNFMASPIRRLMFKEKPRPEMDWEVRKRLMEKYKPEVQTLSKLLRRDLVKLWGYDKI